MSAPFAGLRPSYLRVRGAPDPLGSFRTLYGGERHGFLYESLSCSGGGGRGRYSFLGGRPLLVLTGRDGAATVEGPRLERRVIEHAPLDLLAELLASGVEALPVASFPGGAVGYLAYDVARRFLPLGPGPQNDLAWPDLVFLFPSEVVVVDHLDEVAHILVYGRKSRAARCFEIGKVLGRQRGHDAGASARTASGAAVSSMSFAEWAARVERIRAHIREGDAYQVVLSRRFELHGVAPPLELYAALRRRNPSPYMYYLALDGRHLAGSSPETLVKLSGRRVTVRPLAGTRPRGGSDAADDAAASELLADPKERAEHVMLVDLARNDIGRVCETGSVALGRLMEIERYASVMHLVSDVEGRLREDRDGFDLTRACFPAGTVSGAPKIRAMQLIDELEPTRRGPYAGAIGYFSFLGDLDLCIAIRTVVLERGRARLQAGAGIVADSDPLREFEETASKARGILGALGSADRATMGPCATAANDSPRARSAGSTA